MADGPFALVVAPAAERGLRRLTVAAGSAVAQFMLGDLLKSPRRVGKPLGRDLSGWWSSRRGPYRLVYRIDESERTVIVLRIEHRSDLYRPR